MSTIGDALASRDRRLFVGRDRELSVFRSWLTQPGESPKLLSVTGPGGIGKTTLLRAFAREAAALDRPAVLVDGRGIDPSPSGLAAAIGADSWPSAAAHLSGSCSVLLLDSFDDLRPITHFLLEDFLPSLTVDTPVVISSRRDITRSWWPWREVVRVLALGGLPAAQAQEFLRLRGLTDPAEIDRVVQLASGHPLSLSVAADIVLRAGPKALPDGPEWRIAVRSLVQDLLRYVDDPGLRDVLEAASIVRQFDEPTLAAITPGEDVSGAFSRLCALSVVRPGPRGLMLHDEVRGAIREDLRWRNPERFRTLRRRALDHYRRQAQGDDLEETAWAITEAGYLSEDPLIHRGMFTVDDPAEVWAELARPADRRLVLSLQASFAASLAGRRERPAQEELDSALVAALLDRPEVRVQLAWSRTHGAVGYGLALPLLPPVLDLLPADGMIARLAARAFDADAPGDLRRLLPQTDAWFLGTIVAEQEHADAATSVITREIPRLMVNPGVYLTCTADPIYQSVIQAFSFRPLPFDPPAGEFEGMTGFVLDLTLIGSDTFLESVASGTPLPRVPPPAEFERELAAVLEHWHDDAWLTRCALAEFACFRAPAAAGDGPAAVRALVTGALRLARDRSPRDAQAFRAVEFAYLDGSLTLEAAARRLAVSRPTFYRLRKRAVRAMTEAIAASARAGRALTHDHSALYTRL